MRTTMAIDRQGSLEWFERNFVTTRRVGEGKDAELTGAEVRLWLSGDKHHYMRYTERLEAGASPESARRMVTCGLGGAYLDTTHGLADELKLLPPASRTILRTAGPS